MRISLVFSFAFLLAMVFLKVIPSDDAKKFSGVDVSTPTLHDLGLRGTMSIPEGLLFLEEKVKALKRECESSWDFEQATTWEELSNETT